MMKTAPHSFNAEHTEEVSPTEDKQSRSARTRYVLAGVLLFGAYFLSTSLSVTPESASNLNGLGFLFFWLGGGLTTLILLKIAAKR